MSKSLFSRTSSFDQPEVRTGGNPPPPRTPNVRVSSSDGPDLERWYQMVSEWCHPDTRRLSSASWASVPLEQIEELRDELYAFLH